MHEPSAFKTRIAHEIYSNDERNVNCFSSELIKTLFCRQNVSRREHLIGWSQEVKTSWLIEECERFRAVVMFLLRNLIFLPQGFVFLVEYYAFVAISVQDMIKASSTG